MRHDYAACADLCEEHGLARPAAVLRAVAEGACEAYMIRPVDYHADMSDGATRIVETQLRPRPLFLDRSEAERVAAGWNVAGLRGFRPDPFRVRFLLKTDEADFRRRVRALLGMAYRLPDDPSDPLLPDDVTDEQLRAIAPLLRVEFFEVVPVPIMPEEGP